MNKKIAGVFIVVFFISAGIISGANLKDNGKNCSNSSIGDIENNIEYDTGYVEGFYENFKWSVNQKNNQFSKGILDFTYFQ